MPRLRDAWNSWLVFAIGLCAVAVLAVLGSWYEGVITTDGGTGNSALSGISASAPPASQTPARQTQAAATQKAAPASPQHNHSEMAAAPAQADGTQSAAPSARTATQTAQAAVQQPAALSVAGEGDAT